MLVGQAVVLPPWYSNPTIIPRSSVAPLPRQSSDGARRQAEVEAQGPAPARPLLECVLSKDVDLAPVLPWTVAESNEYRRTPIWPGTIEEWPASKAVYRFFLHNIFAGLVPPFSSFFTAILNHYGIQALQLQPNSVLLLSIFAFYCEAFLGVQPSVALFRHFFSLRLHDDAHLLACVSFVAA
ncbi:retrotransposon unclassified [Hordeum vulgare]|nr:retrotransposon unclassified [Hordeum vulgare]